MDTWNSQMRWRCDEGETEKFLMGIIGGGMQRDVSRKSEEKKTVREGVVYRRVL